MSESPNARSFLEIMSDPLLGDFLGTPATLFSGSDLVAAGHAGFDLEAGVGSFYPKLLVLPEIPSSGARVELDEGKSIALSKINLCAACPNHYDFLIDE
jgi:hypothetical protein